MNYLLDTCILSELTKLRPHPAIEDWLERCDELQLYLSVLTLGELQRGVTKLPGSKKKERLQTWINHDLCERFEGRVLQITQEVAMVWGQVQGAAENVGRKMPAIDSLIAATARVHQLTVVTRNTPDMAASGAEIFDPWA